MCDQGHWAQARHLQMHHFSSRIYLKCCSFYASEYFSLIFSQWGYLRLKKREKDKDIKEIKHNQGAHKHFQINEKNKNFLYVILL